MPRQPKVLAEIICRGEIERGLIQELQTVGDGDLKKRKKKKKNRKQSFNGISQIWDSS